MTQIQTFENSSFKVQCVCVSGEPWFRGRDVATILGYNNTTQALIKNVDDDDKKKMEELGVPKWDPPMATKGGQCILTNQVSIP